MSGASGKWIHLGTQVQTVFGLLDEQGNVIRRVPVNAQMDVIGEDAFTEAARAILAEKAKLEGGGTCPTAAAS